MVLRTLAFFLIACSIGCGETPAPPEGKDVVCGTPDGSILHSGDIIFQMSVSGQSTAIMLATRSAYSHCGILVYTGSGWMVLEAVQPVKLTSLEEWIKKGKEEHYVVKRPVGSDSLHPVRLLNKAEEYLGRDYDLVFSWSDDKMYCSELVWKIYHSFGKELCSTKKLKDFDLSHPEVKKIMEKRYGKSVPMEETVVSPADLFNSELLMEIMNK